MQRSARIKEKDGTASLNGGVIGMNRVSITSGSNRKWFIVCEKTSYTDILSSGSSRSSSSWHMQLVMWRIFVRGPSVNSAPNLPIEVRARWLPTNNKRLTLLCKCTVWKRIRPILEPKVLRYKQERLEHERRNVLSAHRAIIHTSYQEFQKRLTPSQWKYLPRSTYVHWARSLQCWMLNLTSRSPPRILRTAARTSLN